MISQSKSNYSRFTTNTNTQRKEIAEKKTKVTHTDTNGIEYLKNHSNYFEMYNKAYNWQYLRSQMEFHSQCTLFTSTYSLHCKMCNVCV